MPPPVKSKRTSALSIELENGDAAYAPGDIIIGRVFRTKDTASAHAEVRITLHGHTQSKIEQTYRSGDSSRTVVSETCFDLVDHARRTQRLATGPLRISDEDGSEGSWPFAIEVPVHVEASCFERLPPDQSGTFLSTAPGDVASHPLPGSFHNPSYDADGLVEYWLRATITLSAQGKPEEAEARLPVTIDTVVPGPRVADHKISHATYRAQVSTHRLVPGKAGAKLSLSQRAQELFGSSKVPTFAGSLEFSHATVVQLENPEPLPILARFVPDPHQTSEKLTGVPQKVRLARLVMSIHGNTGLRCHSAQAGGVQKSQVALWPPPRRDGDKRPVTPFYIPCTEEWPPVDIGEHVRLRLGRKGIVGMPKLYPTFTTYNIQRTYKVGFEIEIEIAGERTKHEAESVLEVIPSVDKRPPGSVMASLPPPSFAEATQGRPESELRQSGLSMMAGGIEVGAGVAIDVFDIMTR